VTPRKISRYELFEEIGRGNMGVVYRARDPLVDRTVAIKAIRLGFSLDEANRRLFLERFQREAQIAGKLSHPHIIAIHDFGAGDEPYIVMEYFPGTSLSVLAERGPLPLEDVELIMRQLASALAYAHERGVIHRDIKPANVLYQNGRIKLLDFGIAKLEASELTATGEFLGTPSYMAPERFSGRVAGGRSDLFSMGVVIYLLLTGRKPFEGANVSQTIYRVLHEEPAAPSSLRTGIPPGWDRILSKLLAKAPEARYATAGDLLEDLDRLPRGDAPRERKLRLRLGLAAVGVVLTLGLLGFFGLLRDDTVLPLRFVARHEHRVGHCTGDLSFEEAGVSFESPRHGKRRFSAREIESLLWRAETEIELRAHTARGSETFRFTFLRPALEEAAFREYQGTIFQNRK
jgi:serine/threonine protein kinase